MYSKSCRSGPRALPWEPYPRWAGLPRSRAPGPRDAWCYPPWEHEPWRARGRRHLRDPRQPRPFPGPADFRQRDADGRWAAQNYGVLPPPWNYREDQQSREPNEYSRRTSSLRGSRLEGHFGKMPHFYGRGPRAFPWEPYPRWAGPPRSRAPGPQDAWCYPPWEHEPWRARGRRHLRDPRQPRPFPGPADFRQRDADGRWAAQNYGVLPPPWNYREDQQSRERLRGPVWRRRRLLRPIKREPTDRSRSPRRSQGYRASSVLSRSSEPGLRERLDAPLSPTASKSSMQSEEQVDEDPLAGSSQALELGRHAERSPEKSPATDPQAAEEQPAAGSEPVEPEGGQEVADIQQPFVWDFEPVSSAEISSTGSEESLELIKLCSQSVPEASASAEPYPHSPLSPEPAETVSAELTLEIPLEATVEPSTQHSKASSSVCSEAAASPRTGCPTRDETEPAAGCQDLPRSLCSTPPCASTDSRSATILTKKSIEQLFQLFCLNLATVTVMLIKKNPSREVALTQALRANLQHFGNQLVKELEDFIQQYDATHPTH